MGELARAAGAALADRFGGDAAAGQPAGGGRRCLGRGDAS